MLAGQGNRLNDVELKGQFKRAIEMIQMDKADEALRSLDIAIEEARSNVLVPVLLERATANMRSGNFELAYKDVFDAIENAPQAPEAYIQACNFYLIQGNYRDAWLTAEKGMAAVPSTDPNWRGLKSLKSASLAEINKTNIWQLPYDILSKIAEKLTLVDRIHLADSCKYWRSVIHDSPAVRWSNLDLRPFWNQPEMFKEVFAGVLSQYVRTLRSCNEDIIDCINELEWKDIEHLETMEIEESHPYLQELIVRNAETLKTLDIASPGRHFPDAGNIIQYIFSTCPRLTSFALYIVAVSPGLEYTHTSDINHDFNPFKFTATATTLTHLTLTGLGFFSTMLPSCPNLLHIRLYEDFDFVDPHDIFVFAEKCCPKLITLLCIHCNDSERNCIKLIDSHPTTVPPTEKGIRHLAYFPGNVVDENAVATIVKNRSTLEHLQFGLGKYVLPLVAVKNLSKSPFPRLTQLELHGLRRPHFGSTEQNLSSDKIYDLIRTCPVLESLTLVHIDIFDDGMFLLLGEIATLRKLHIVGHISSICSHSRGIVRCGIRTLFERTKSLKDVKFHTLTSSIPLGDFIYAMSARPELEKIHLEGDGGIVIDSTRLQQAKGLLNVRTLTIGCSNILKVVNSDLRLFEWMPSLSTVKLEGKSVLGITDKGLDCVFRNRRQRRLDITVNDIQETKTEYSSATWNYAEYTAAFHL